MKRDPKIFLQDILDCIEKIESYVANLDRAGFEADSKTRDAVVRNIEIIGEAIKNLPPKLRLDHNQVEWKEIAGMRDILAHAYWDIDVELIWGVVKNDIRNLSDEVEKIIKSY